MKIRDIWIIWGLVFALFLGVAVSASAEPSAPPNKRFFWSHDGQGIAGFYFYYAPESESPRVYSNARRVQIANPDTKEIIILSSGIGTGRWCGKVTAYNADGDESAYSNETCGRFFVLNAPTEAGVE